MKSSSRHLLQIGLTTNIFEWYEFIVFAYLAETMGNVFFGNKVSSIAIINTFAVFAISYFIRPIGSIFFGYIGDKYSTEKVMRYTIVLMAFPTVIIGVLPSYAQIGIISPICLILLRLIQGFAAGGELPNSASYIYNKSLQAGSNKIMLCSLPSIGSMSGALLASLVIFILYKLFNHVTIIDWAWRLPFLLGFPLLIFILYIRRSISNLSTNAVIIPKSLPNKKYWGKFVIAFILTGFLQISFYILFVWLPSHLELSFGVSHQMSSYTNVLGMITGLVSTVFFGYLAKWICHKKLLRFGILGISISVYPILAHITDSLSATVFFQMFLGVMIGCIDGVYFYTIGKLFPDHLRNRGTSITFTCASAFLGGTSPLLCSYIIKNLHWMNFPAFYIVFFGTISLLVSFWL